MKPDTSPSVYSQSATDFSIELSVSKGYTKAKLMSRNKVFRRDMNLDLQTETMVDLRINETFQTGAVGNRTYRVGLNAVRLETAPTGGKSVYLFLEFTII